MVRVKLLKVYLSNMNKNLNIINKDSSKNKDNNTNNYYKQVFANPMRTYSKEERDRINKHLNKLNKEKNK